MTAIGPVSASPLHACGTRMRSDSARQPPQRRLLGELESVRRDVQQACPPACHRQWDFAVFIGPRFEETSKLPFAQPTCLCQFPNGRPPQRARSQPTFLATAPASRVMEETRGSKVARSDESNSSQRAITSSDPAGTSVRAAKRFKSRTEGSLRSLSRCEIYVGSTTSFSANSRCDSPEASRIRFMA